MAKAIINRAVARVAEEIRVDGVSDLELAAMESHEHGVEGYVRYALEAKLRDDVKAEKRAIRDANKAGMSEDVCLPGLERGAFPLGIPVIRDGSPMSVHYSRATLDEIETEVKASRRENKAEDARIAKWEQTVARLRELPESSVNAPVGELLEAFKTRLIAESN